MTTLNYAPPVEFDLSYKHLQLMLMRIDLHIHREARRWQQANDNAADLLRGQYISDAEVNALLKLPFGMHWRHLVAEEGDGAYDKAFVQADQQIELLLSRAPAGHQPRLLHLAECFGLSEFELDALLVVLAPAFDLRYERLYGYLLDDATRKRPSVNLTLDLLCNPDPQRLLMLSYFQGDAPLFKYGFIELTDEPGMVAPPLLNRAMIPDQALVSWLLGQYQPHKSLQPFVNRVEQQNGQADFLVAAPQLQELAKTSETEPLLAFYGVDQEAQEAAARLLAQQMEAPLLHIQLDKLIATKLPGERSLRLALREARLLRAVPLITGWDSCLDKGAPESTLLKQLYNYPGTVVVSGEQKWQARGMVRERAIIWLKFGMPDYAHRRQVWSHFLADAPDDLALDKLAGQFLLSAGQIRDVSRTAYDTAIKFGRELQDEDLFTAAREHSSPKLGDMARKINPRYSWEDLVLPRDPIAILQEIVSTVLGRPRVLEEWGAGKKLAYSGVTVLFAGSPGTGKTMGAEVIANELHQDLYKIDLSAVVSKYIGETEKNLERIFNEAQSSNAILFFDEADSIFGKRSEVKDAHDRYANLEVSYLLQRMESYDGVTILATNLRANLDEAFMRRLQFAVDFPFPEWQDRLRIWKTLFPATIPHDPAIDFELFAKRFKLAGGNIRNIIVSAAYLAAAQNEQVTMTHMMHGARRELQKMGRLVNKDDFEF